MLLWMPRGPVGLVLFAVLLALIVALAFAVSVLLLVGAVVAAVAFAAYGSGRALLRERLGAGRELPEVRGRFLDRRVPPLEHYLDLVDEFDKLTTEAIAVDAAGSASWRAGRRLSRLLARATTLREQAIQVERWLSADRGAEAARPGMWELIVAATELQHYLQALLEFPSSRGRAAQARELALLHERHEEVERRRDELVRRLQDTDLRFHSRAAGG